MALRCRQAPPELRGQYPMREIDVCQRHEGHKGEHRSTNRVWQQLARFSFPREKAEAQTGREAGKCD